MRASAYQNMESQETEVQCPVECSTKGRALGAQGIKQQKYQTLEYTSKATLEVHRLAHTKPQHSQSASLGHQIHL